MFALSNQWAPEGRIRRCWLELGAAALMPLMGTSPKGPGDLAPPKRFKEAMFAQSIPLASFEVADMQQECARLKSRGVVFTRERTNAGPVIIAVFSDTCGNLIQLHQPV